MSETLPSTTPPEGELLSGRYRLVRKLGTGGMGTVWEARHATLARRFAVKFLKPELAEKPEARRRFEREARAAGGIESEHVVAVLDHGVTHAGEPFLVMEYLEGETLATLLEREQVLPVFRAASIVLQAARGVDRAHRHGIVHRDLKPQNLFLNRRDDGGELCKVLDFGVAKLAAHGSGISTKTGHLIGTLDYMSPEQLRGDPTVDVRSDVYALGCVLYECLAGRRPYHAEQAHVLMYRILEAQLTRLETLRPELPPGLAELVHRALEADPERRFPTVAELGACLAPYADRLGSSAARPPPDTPTRASPPSSLDVPLRTRGRKLRRWPVAALLVVLALGTVAGARVLGGTRARADSRVAPSAVNSPTVPDPRIHAAAPEAAPPRPSSAPPTLATPAPTASAPTTARRPAKRARATPSATAARREAAFDFAATPYD